MASVVTSRAALPPLHATLSRTERREVADWSLARASFVAHARFDWRAWLGTGLWWTLALRRAGVAAVDGGHRDLAPRVPAVPRHRPRSAGVRAVVAWVPTALTGNPVGAVLVHDSDHAAANVHTYCSPIYLPPDLDGYAERGSGSAGLGLAGIWLVLAGTAIDLERRRLFPRSVEVT